jgi:hypothetical protein
MMEDVSNVRVRYPKIEIEEGAVKGKVGTRGSECL